MHPGALLIDGIRELRQAVRELHERASDRYSRSFKLAYRQPVFEGCLDGLLD